MKPPVQPFYAANSQLLQSGNGTLQNRLDNEVVHTVSSLVQNKQSIIRMSVSNAKPLVMSVCHKYQAGVQ